MSDRSQISWTDATWNPIAGCSLVSPGCTNCYAMRRVAPRLAANPATPHYAGTVKKTKAGYVWTGKIGIASDAVLFKPLRWKRPRMIFMNSTSDLFHPDVPDKVIDRIVAVMALSPQHIFQVLTKRPERMRAYMQALTLARLMAASVGMPSRFRAMSRFPLPNVWLGTSVEDQQRADERIPLLLDTPAAVRFISAEPLLGPIDLTTIKPAAGSQLFGFDRIDATRGTHHLSDHVYSLPQIAPGPIRLDWVIVGGESGNGARPMHPDWARSLRDQCATAGVPFHFKQWGEWAPGENADRAQTRTERTAQWFGPEDGNPSTCWHYRSITVSESEEMHRDDEPDVWRFGTKAAGRLLDGVEHNGMPAAPSARSAPR